MTIIQNVFDQKFMLKSENKDWFLILSTPLPNVI